MPPEETLDLLGVVTPSDEAIHVHPSSRSSSVIGHHDHKPKRRKHNVNDALQQEFTAARPKMDAEGGVTEPAARAGGAHRSQRRAPTAAAKSTEAGGGSSSKDDDKASASAAPPASSRFIRFKHSSWSLVIGGGSSEQHPVAGSSSGGAPPLLPKARRQPSAFAASGIVPREPDEDAEYYFRRGVAAFGSLDVAAQLAEVKKFTGVGQQPQLVAEGGAFSFWLTPQQADDDLYVYDKVNNA